MFRSKRKSKHKLQQKRQGTSLITLAKPSSVITEQIRTIRTNIQFSMIDKELKTLVFTSAGPGEGKSTVSANVAVVFAKQGKKVLLVDADMRKPTIHSTFKVPNNEGLTTLLTEKEINLENVIKETVDENLFILTSGPIPPNPSELLDSNKMNFVIEMLTNTYDLIIFDMPPIVTVTDAQIMASKSDGTIFVVRNGVANKDTVLKAKQLLTIVNANVIGTVFNGVEKTADTAYRYYGLEGE